MTRLHGLALRFLAVSLVAGGLWLVAHPVVTELILSGRV